LEYRDLGQTGMCVSEISLGTWAFGDGWGTVSEDDVLGALNRAVDLGVKTSSTRRTFMATDAARSSSPDSLRTSGSLGLESELVNNRREDNLQEDPKVEKERETKDDGRYIIFYTFEDAED
jgi:hypothetical protein